MEIGKKFWLNGSIYDIDKEKISILTHSLHYGTGVFEGIRCFNINGKLISFRLKDHIARLFRSAEAYSIKMQYTKEQILEACRSVVKANGSLDFYIRPLIYYGAGEMGVGSAKNPVHSAIIVWTWPSYLGKGTEEKGVKCMISSWMKIPNESLPQYAKGIANYANSRLAKMEAINKGYDESILLNRNGLVTECSGENIFIVKDGKIKTPAVSVGILEGITRDSIITIAKKLKLSVTEGEITKEELLDADEAFLTGTAAGVHQISKINDKNFQIKEDSISGRLKNFYFGIISGEKTGFDIWLDRI